MLCDLLEVTSRRSQGFPAGCFNFGAMTMNPDLSRRDFVGLTGMASLGLGWTLTQQASANSVQEASRTPEDVLKDLLDGNARFASGAVSNPRRTPKDFSALEESQKPEALIITCADARVPPELLFDQGVGDLFVIRIAGNIVDGSGIVVKGSIEYAITELNVPLIMVLGHSNCGAVKAAVNHIDKDDVPPGALNELIGLIKPAVERSKLRPGVLLENAIRENVITGVERLKRLDAIVSRPATAGPVKIVGATYDLRTGLIQILA